MFIYQKVVAQGNYILLKKRGRFSARCKQAINIQILTTNSHKTIVKIAIKHIKRIETKWPKVTLLYLTLNLWTLESKFWIGLQKYKFKMN